MRKRLPALLLSVLALGSLAGCSKSLSADDVETQIVSELKGDGGATLDSASCPGDLEAKVGATIMCTGQAGEDEIKIEVKVTAVDGNNAKFDITVVQ